MEKNLPVKIPVNFENLFYYLYGMIQGSEFYDLVKDDELLKQAINPSWIVPLGTEIIKGVK